MTSISQVFVSGGFPVSGAWSLRAPAARPKPVYCFISVRPQMCICAHFFFRIKTYCIAAVLMHFSSFQCKRTRLRGTKHWGFALLKQGGEANFTYRVQRFTHIPVTSPCLRLHSIVGDNRQEHNLIDASNKTYVRIRESLNKSLMSPNTFTLMKRLW